MIEKNNTTKNIISILIILFLLFIISFQEKFNQFISKKNMKFLLLLLLIYIIYMKFDLIYLIIFLCSYIVSTTNFSDLKKNTYIKRIQKKIEEFFSDNFREKKKEDFENKEIFSTDSSKKNKEELNQLEKKIDEIKQIKDYFDVKPFALQNQIINESDNKDTSLEENNSSLENQSSIEKNNSYSSISTKNSDTHENFIEEQNNHQNNNQEHKELLEKLNQFQFENSSDNHESQSSPIEPFKDQVSDLNNLFQEIETNFKNNI
jgi:hypothetical protein